MHGIGSPGDTGQPYICAEGWDTPGTPDHPYVQGKYGLVASLTLIILVDISYPRIVLEAK